MRRCLLLMCVLSCSAFGDYPISFAGSGSGYASSGAGIGALDYYDRENGLLYTFFTPSNDEEDKSSARNKAATNVFIYNTKTKVGRNLFNENKDRISGVALESGYYQGGVSYFSYGAAVKNNEKQQKMHDSFIVETYSEKDKTFTVWRASKLEGEPRVMFNYKAPERWHLDAMQGIIRVLKPKDGTYSVTEYVW